MLQEASNGIDALEGRISTMSVEREEERSRLEDKMKQLEEDLGDQTSSILFGTQLLMDHHVNTSNGDVDSNILSSPNVNSSMNMKLTR